MDQKVGQVVAVEELRGEMYFLQCVEKKRMIVFFAWHWQVEIDFDSFF